METKTMDNLLNELNELQLSKESMSCIAGGVPATSYETSSGTVYFVHNSDGSDTIWFKGATYWPTTLPTNDRNRCMYHDC